MLSLFLIWYSWFDFKFIFFKESLFFSKLFSLVFVLSNISVKNNIFRRNSGKKKIVYLFIHFLFDVLFFVLFVEQFSLPISWRSWRKPSTKLTIQTFTPEKCSPWRLSCPRTEYRCVVAQYVCTVKRRGAAKLTSKSQSEMLLFLHVWASEGEWKCRVGHCRSVFTFHVLVKMASHHLNSFGIRVLAQTLNSTKFCNTWVKTWILQCTLTFTHWKYLKEFLKYFCVSN